MDRRIINAFGQSLYDVASLPLPAFSGREAILDAIINQVLASPTNVGEAEALRAMKQSAPAPVVDPRQREIDAAYAAWAAMGGR